MAISKRLKKYLKENKVKHKIFKHPEAFTSQEVAAAQHVPGHRVLKTVVVKLDERAALAAVPAPGMVNFKKLKKLSGAKKVEMATEAEIKKLIPDCEVGAMTPLGSLYELPVYVDRELESEANIVFNAESHTDTVQISFSDFKRLAQPTLGDITGTSA